MSMLTNAQAFLYMHSTPAPPCHADQAYLCTPLPSPGPLSPTCIAGVTTAICASRQRFSSLVMQLTSCILQMQLTPCDICLPFPTPTPTHTTPPPQPELHPQQWCPTCGVSSSKAYTLRLLLRSMSSGLRPPGASTAAATSTTCFAVMSSQANGSEAPGASVSHTQLAAASLVDLCNYARADAGCSFEIMAC